MKTVKYALVSIIALLATCYAVSGQWYEYRRGKNLEAFTGTWQYATATDTFTLSLWKGKYTDDTGYMTIDRVYGYHSYKKNGVQQNIYLHRPDVWALDKYTFRMTNADEDYDDIDPNEVSGTFRDYQKRYDQIIRGSLTLVKGKPNEMIWKVSDIQPEKLSISMNGEAITSPHEDGCTLPDTMRLVKIKESEPEPELPPLPGIIGKP